MCICVRNPRLYVRKLEKTLENSRDKSDCVAETASARRPKYSWETPEDRWAQKTARSRTVAKDGTRKGRGGKPLSARKTPRENRTKHAVSRRPRDGKQNKSDKDQTDGYRVWAVAKWAFPGRPIGPESLGGPGGGRSMVLCVRPAFSRGWRSSQAQAVLSG